MEDFMDEVRLLKEMELRTFNLNEKSRERYIARAIVAGAAVILDSMNPKWIDGLNPAELKTQSCTQALAIVRTRVWFEEHEDLTSAITAMQISLGLEYPNRTTYEELAAAWIEEITIRRIRRHARNFFNI